MGKCCFLGFAVQNNGLQNPEDFSEFLMYRKPLSMCMMQYSENSHARLGLLNLHFMTSVTHRKSYIINHDNDMGQSHIASKNGYCTLYVEPFPTMVKRVQIMKIAANSIALIQISSTLQGSPALGLVGIDAFGK